VRLVVATRNPHKLDELERGIEAAALRGRAGVRSPLG